MADEFSNTITKIEQQTTNLPAIIRNSLKSFRGSNNSLETLENAMKIKEKFAFYNQQTFLELSKCLEQKYKRFSENFINFGKNQSVSIMEVFKIYHF